MNPRFILITTAAILLAGCDRRSAEAEAAKAAELAQQRQSELAANEKIRQLEDRLNAAEQQKAVDREAELARVKDELEQTKRDKELAAERIRELQNQTNKPAPIAEAPGRNEDASQNTAIRADLERVVEEEEEQEDRDPVYVGRVVPETQRVANVESFYEPLDEYGDWVETDDYGYVFRPAVATRPGWRPYTDGHWVHTRLGWTWQSNEEFGWATYHYGRWSRIAGSGWVWVPGREWGPGWVSWRRGTEHCGWAPLPPESRTRVSFTATVDRDYGIGPAAYVFVALSNFGARSYAPVIERPERNVTIINKTVNITNITYNNTANNTVVYNKGPNYDIIRARSKQPVENVNVNFVQQASSNDVRRKVVNLRQGDNFQVAAPPVAATVKAAPPRVKERLGKPKEDKGWEGVDPAQAQKVKQNIVATSTELPKRVRPSTGAANTAAPAPATPATAVPPVAPARPQRPAIATPDATKPPQITPPPAAPVRPAIVDKPDEPKRPAVSEPPKMREQPESEKPKPATELPPKVDRPDEPKKPAVPEPEKKREPETEPPKPTPQPPPKTDRPDEPKKPADNEPRKIRDVEKPATPPPARIAPRRQETLPPPPVNREKPRATEPADPPARPRTEAPAKAKPPVEAPVRVRPTATPAPQAAVRQRQIERRSVAPEVTAPASRPVVENPQQPVRKVAQTERPPQVQRAPEPQVKRNVPPPAPQRAPAPVVQRPPQPPAPQQSAKPQKATEESDEKKKGKKENER